MEEERKKLRIIHVFDNGEDAAKEMFGLTDGGTKKSGIRCMVGELQFLMNVAYTVYLYMLHYEAGEISKTELDLFLRTEPLPAKTIVNVSPVDFNFVFWSSINKRFYTNREYDLENLDLVDAYSAITESYDELSHMYSFDSIIEQMQKMVTDFKTAHHDFSEMTMSERITKFRSWNGNEDYINNTFLVSLLGNCRKEKIKK